LSQYYQENQSLSQLQMYTVSLENEVSKLVAVTLSDLQILTDSKILFHDFSIAFTVVYQLQLKVFQLF